MKLPYYFTLAGLFILLFSGCENNDDVGSTGIDLNPVFQTRETATIGFVIVPVTSELFLSTLEQPANGEIINAGIGRYLLCAGKAV